MENISKKVSAEKLILIGQQAKTSMFKSECKNKNIIHLATHGYLDKESIKNSWILFADKKLKLPELYELKLEKTNLVILSACETGLGKDGIETTSLARAFSDAGVRNIIASLWPVEDESTRLIMEEFYDNVLVGESYRVALRNAKLKLIAEGGKFSAPEYWAPFILQGKTD
ncbi:MAG: CHAT domain-containing protein [Brumimicrobium sp.]|nr:CHAT domain-containing protein [Brumimicrobium sp.]